VVWLSNTAVNQVREEAEGTARGLRRNAASRALRSPTAIRRPNAARLVSGLWSSPSSQLRPTRRLPEPSRGPVATVPSSTLHYRCGGSAGIHRLPNSPARRRRAGTFSAGILLDLVVADQ
jgi:hypothetical protein